MKVLLAFKGKADRNLVEAIRRVVDVVVEELRRKLKAEMERALSGRPIALAGVSCDPRPISNCLT